MTRRRGYNKRNLKKMEKFQIKAVVRKKDNRQRTVELFADILKCLYANETAVQEFKRMYNNWFSVCTSHMQSCESAKSNALEQLKFPRVARILTVAIIFVCALESFFGYSESHLILGLWLYATIVVMNFASAIAILYIGSSREFTTTIHQYLESVCTMFQFFNFRLNMLRLRYNLDINSAPSLHTKTRNIQTKNYRNVFFSAISPFNIYGFVIGVLVFASCHYLELEIFMLLESSSLYLAFIIAIAKDIQILGFIRNIGKKRNFMKNSTADFLLWFEGKCEINRILQQYEASDYINSLFPVKPLRFSRKAKYLDAAIVITACEAVMHLKLPKHDFENVLMFLVYGKYLASNEFIIESVSTEVKEVLDVRNLDEENCIPVKLSPTARSETVKKELPESMSTESKKEMEELVAYSNTPEGKYCAHGSESKISEENTVDSRGVKWTGKSPKLPTSSSNLTTNCEKVPKTKDFDESLQLRHELQTPKSDAMNESQRSPVEYSNIGEEDVEMSSSGVENSKSPCCVPHNTNCISKEHILRCFSDTTSSNSRNSLDSGVNNESPPSTSENNEGYDKKDPGLNEGKNMDKKPKEDCKIAKEEYSISNVECLKNSNELEMDENVQPSVAHSEMFVDNCEKIIALNEDKENILQMDLQINDDLKVRQHTNSDTMAKKNENESILDNETAVSSTSKNNEGYDKKDPGLNEGRNMDKKPKEDCKVAKEEYSNSNVESLKNSNELEVDENVQPSIAHSEILVDNCEKVIPLKEDKESTLQMDLQINDDLKVRQHTNSDTMAKKNENERILDNETAVPNTMKIRTSDDNEHMNDIIRQESAQQQNLETETLVFEEESPSIKLPILGDSEQGMTLNKAAQVNFGSVFLQSNNGLIIESDQVNLDLSKLSYGNKQHDSLESAAFVFMKNAEEFIDVKNNLENEIAVLKQMENVHEGHSKFKTVDGADEDLMSSSKVSENAEKCEDSIDESNKLHFEKELFATNESNTKHELRNETSGIVGVTSSVVEDAFSESCSEDIQNVIDGLKALDISSIDINDATEIHNGYKLLHVNECTNVNSMEEIENFSDSDGHDKKGSNLNEERNLNRIAKQECKAVNSRDHLVTLQEQTGHHDKDLSNIERCSSFSVVKDAELLETLKSEIYPLEDHLATLQGQIGLHDKDLRDIEPSSFITAARHAALLQTPELEIYALEDHLATSQGQIGLHDKDLRNIKSNSFFTSAKHAESLQTPKSEIYALEDHLPTSQGQIGLHDKDLSNIEPSSFFTAARHTESFQKESEMYALEDKLATPQEQIGLHDNDLRNIELCTSFSAVRDTVSLQTPASEISELPGANTIERRRIKKPVRRNKVGKANIVDQKTFKSLNLLPTNETMEHTVNGKNAFIDNNVEKEASTEDTVDNLLPKSHKDRVILKGRRVYRHFMTDEAVGTSPENICISGINFRLQNYFKRNTANNLSLNERKILLADNMPIKTEDTVSEISFSHESSLAEYSESANGNTPNDFVSANDYAPESTNHIKWVHSLRFSSGTTTPENVFGMKSVNPPREMEPEKNTGMVNVPLETESFECVEPVHARVKLYQLWKLERSKTCSQLPMLKKAVEEEIFLLERHLQSNGSSDAYRGSSSSHIKDEEAFLKTEEGEFYARSSMVDATNDFPEMDESLMRLILDGNENSKEILSSEGLPNTGSSEDPNFHFNPSTSPSDTSSEESAGELSKSIVSEFSASDPLFWNYEHERAPEDEIADLKGGGDISDITCDKTSTPIKWTCKNVASNTQAKSCESTSDLPTEFNKKSEECLSMSGKLLDNSNYLTFDPVNSENISGHNIEYTNSELQFRDGSVPSYAMNENSFCEAKSVTATTPCADIRGQFDTLTDAGGTIVCQPSNQGKSQTDPSTYHLKYENLDLELSDSSPFVTIRLIDEKDGDGTKLPPKYRRMFNGSLSSSKSNNTSEILLPSEKSTASSGNTSKEDITITTDNLLMSVKNKNSEQTPLHAYRNLKDEKCSPECHTHETVEVEGKKDGSISVYTKSEGKGEVHNKQDNWKDKHNSQVAEAVVEDANDACVELKKVETDARSATFSPKEGDDCNDEISPDVADVLSSILDEVRPEDQKTSTKPNGAFEVSPISGCENNPDQAPSDARKDLLIVSNGLHDGNLVLLNTNDGHLGSSPSVIKDEETSKDFHFEARGVKLNYKPNSEHDSIEVKFRHMQDVTRLTFKSPEKKLYIKMSSHSSS